MSSEAEENEEVEHRARARMGQVGERNRDELSANDQSLRDVITSPMLHTWPLCGVIRGLHSPYTEAYQRYTIGTSIRMNHRFLFVMLSYQSVSVTIF